VVEHLKPSDWASGRPHDVEVGAILDAERDAVAGTGLRIEEVGAALAGGERSEDQESKWKCR